jgi:transposase
VGDDRKKESLDAFYRQLTPAQREAIEAVSMDMWEAFIQSTQEHIPNAKDKIVFDKFHVVGHLNEAVDKVRRSEHKALLSQGDSPLKGTKYLWLKNPENFTRDDRRDFSSLRESHLKTARAWAIKQTAMELWGYTYVGAARRFFDEWYGWAIRSRLDPIKKVARMMKERLENILTHLKERVTNALAEGINSMIQWIKYTARGFRNRQNFKTAILFHLGGLDLYPH